MLTISCAEKLTEQLQGCVCATRGLYDIEVKVFLSFCLVYYLFIGAAYFSFENRKSEVIFISIPSNNYELNLALVKIQQ